MKAVGFDTSPSGAVCRVGAPHLIRPAATFSPERRRTTLTNADMNGRERTQRTQRGKLKPQTQDLNLDLVVGVSICVHLSESVVEMPF